MPEHPIVKAVFDPEEKEQIKKIIAVPDFIEYKKEEELCAILKISPAELNFLLGRISGVSEAIKHMELILGFNPFDKK